MVSQVRLLDQESQFESCYRKVGRTHGSEVTLAARATRLAFWLKQGEAGAKWLLARVGAETNVEVLDEVAAILRKMDSRVIPLIAKELENEPASELAEMFIRALRRPELARDAGPHYAQVYGIIRKYSCNLAREVRQAAYETALSLRRSDAHQVLDEARKYERDEDLGRVLDDLQHEFGQSAPAGR